jgi:hypothetical protein
MKESKKEYIVINKLHLAIKGNHFELKKKQRNNLNHGLIDTKDNYIRMCIMLP